jgi:hypothetical protein
MIWFAYQYSCVYKNREDRAPDLERDSEIASIGISDILEQLICAYAGLRTAKDDCRAGRFREEGSGFEV